MLVTPMGESEGFPVIHGPGPVQCEVGFVWSRDGSGHASGHYILLRSWATLDASQRAFEHHSDVLRRRLRGKQPAPPGYQAKPSLLKKPATSRKPTRQRPAGRRGQSNFCGGNELGPCQFNTRHMAQASRGRTGQRCCIFCQKPEMDVALGTARGRGSISRSLKLFAAFEDQAILKEALRLQIGCQPSQARSRKQSGPRDQQHEPRRQPTGQRCSGKKPPASGRVDGDHLQLHNARPFDLQCWQINVSQRNASFLKFHVAPEAKVTTFWLSSE